MKITIVKTQDGYSGVHTGKGSEEIIELFGTNILPTPFTSRASPNEVLAKIK